MTLLFLTTPALAATVVSSTGLGLDEAIANAEAGDTLLVSDGEWSSVIVDKDLSIEAVGSEIRIDGIYAVDGAQVSVFGCGIGSVGATDDATLSLDSVIDDLWG